MLPCNAAAMLLVAVQSLASYGVATAAHYDRRILSALSRWPSLLAGALLLFLGAWSITGSHPVLAWLSFTVGATVLSAQFSRTAPAKFKRSALQSGLLLLLAALLAPLLNYYSGLMPQLIGSTGALLVLMVLFLVWPCPALDGFLSGFGSVLFAVWTVHDVSHISCESPLVKSTQIFLDLLNLVGFTSR